MNPRSTYQRRPTWVWHTSTSVIEHDDPSLWFAFVALNRWPVEDRHPEVFFVSCKEVIECMKGEVGQSRTFYWMFCDDAGGFSGPADMKDCFVKRRNWDRGANSAFGLI